MRRLRDAQAEALDEEQEGVEESARKRDVVVEHQQPIVPIGRVALEQVVEILELAPVTNAGPVKPHVVMGPQQLRARGGEEVGLVLALHGQREHPPPRARRRCPPQPPRLQAADRPGIRHGIGDDRAGGGADAVDLPAGAREEVGGRVSHGVPQAPRAGSRRCGRP